MSASYALLPTACIEHKVNNLEKKITESDTVILSKLSAAQKDSVVAPKWKSPPVFPLPPPGTKAFTYIPYLSKRNSELKEKIAIDYSQTILLKKLNQYRRRAGKALLDEKGYCHGLTLYWLYLNSQQAGEDYYQQIREILSCPEAELLNHAALFDRFIENIERGQNPQTAIKSKTCKVQQENIDIILNTTEVIPPINLKNISQSELLTQLTTAAQNGRYLVISGNVPDVENNQSCRQRHTIGIICKNNKFILFDANSSEGEPSEFDSLSTLSAAIWECFEDITNLPVQNLGFEMHALVPPPYVPPVSSVIRRLSHFPAAMPVPMTPASEMDLSFSAVMMPL